MQKFFFVETKYFETNESSKLKLVSEKLLENTFRFDYNGFIVTIQQQPLSSFIRELNFPFLLGWQKLWHLEFSRVAALVLIGGGAEVGVEVLVRGRVHGGGSRVAPPLSLLCPLCPLLRKGAVLIRGVLFAGDLHYLQLGVIGF